MIQHDPTLSFFLLKAWRCQLQGPGFSQGVQDLHMHLPRLLQRLRHQQRRLPRPGRAIQEQQSLCVEDVGLGSNGI